MPKLFKEKGIDFSIIGTETVRYTYAKKMNLVYWFTSKPKTTNLVDEENIRKIIVSMSQVKIFQIQHEKHNPCKKNYYIDCGDSFNFIYICQNLPNCIFLM